ncbi:hypothetical protein NA57DRAFT_37864 [Rhizodiscina lignyota]|uniref:Protein SQS1 n=1 Tax=Rhizodiscina lignyota TaxID=1504668 RepID=A0A9P4M759_9PEZI|nr:hypothetical protein NA57DRAFT_37864 [Rhizodiscina lignyota]
MAPRREEAANAFHPFSMRDEVLNTERGHKFWNSDSKLRHKAITFVSAGRLEGAELSRTDDTGEESSTSPSPRRTEVESTKTPPTATQSSPPLFFIDTTPSNIPLPDMPPPKVRPASPAHSDSSDEVLFQGRNAPKKISDPIRKLPSTVGSASTSIEEQQYKVTARQLPQWDQHQVDWVHRSKPGIGWHRPSGLLRGQDVVDPVLRLKEADEEEDEAVADYIANIKENQDSDDKEDMSTSPIFKLRDLALEDGSRMSTACNASTQGDSAAEDNEWDETMLHDFDELSTDQETVTTVVKLLSKRSRPSGVQYLVVSEGETVDDARWIPKSALNSTDALQLINTFEKEFAQKEQQFLESEETSNSDDDDEVDDDDDDDAEEEEDSEVSDEMQDIVDQVVAGMDDEHLARLLNKQEELGLGSDELLLFDDESEGDEIPEIVKQALKPKERKKQAKSKRGRDSFPDASLMADVLDQDPYGGFDVMDFDRPSLRQKKKGRKLEKTSISFGYDGSEELEQTMRATWEADREKKALRKRERAELRSQGLLGRGKKGKPDLNDKYEEGMSFAHMKGEIQQFLQSTHESLALPPMDKKSRKIVHEICSALGLNSKSKGAGRSRFPVLIKTSRTINVNEDVFSMIEKNAARGFFPRMDRRTNNATGKSKGKRGGGGGGVLSGVSYKDGDIVGGSAPEIGAENRGRAMLEKMGWSTGMGLGAVDNKGILLPVTHVVKTSKAGLG